MALGLAAAGSRAAARADASAAELAHCASISSAVARLDCYDELAKRISSATTRPAAAAPATPAAAAGGAPAAAPVAAAAAVAAPAASAAATANPAADPRNFGLSTAQMHNQPPGPQSIEAHVNEVFEDAVLHSFVALDNGQTWQSLEGELPLNKGELVTIRRAALGSFMLEARNSKLRYHVHRVR